MADWLAGDSAARRGLFQGDGSNNVVGYIPSEVAQNLPLQKEGDIVLTAEVLQHIEDSHGKEIQQAGFSDAQSFVDYVMQNVDAIYQEKGNRDFSLVVSDNNPYKMAIIKLEFADGEFYRIKTALPVRDTKFKDKTPLWERAPSNHLQEQTPSAFSGQSGVADTISTDGTQVNLAPNGNVIEVSSADLGVNDGADIKDFIKAAREVYRTFQKTNNNDGVVAVHPELGDIQFTSKGFKESSHTGSDARKWKLVPKLKEIIEGATLVTPEGVPTTDKKGNVIEKRADGTDRFYWLEANVILDGEPLRVGVQVGRNSFGKFYYNLNQDLDMWGEKYNKPSSGTPTQSMMGSGQGLYQDGNASDNINISIVEAPVNRVPQTTPDTARGAFVQRPLDGQAMIALFKGKKDISTVIHEGAGYMFLENLREAASLETYSPI